MKKHNGKWVFGVVLLGILFMVPRTLGVFNADILVGFGINVLFAVSLNMLLTAGLFSFGHALFYGCGAYATALGLFYIKGLPLLLALLLGGFASGLLGLILSPFLVRIGGIYFTLLTIAFNELMYGIVLKFREITGGESGFSSYSVPPLNIPGMGSFDMADKASFYYFAIVIIVISIWLMWFLTKTPFGTVLLGIRNDPERVAYLGFWVPGTKTVIIALSGFFAGIAGSLLALWINVVSPESCLHLINVSIKTFLAILVGGLGTFIGPFIGIGIVHLFNEIILNYGGIAELFIWWIIILYLLFAARYTPWGIMGVTAKIVNRWKQTRKTEPDNRELTD